MLRKAAVNPTTRPARAADVATTVFSTETGLLCTSSSVRPSFRRSSIVSAPVLRPSVDLSVRHSICCPSVNLSVHHESRIRVSTRPEKCDEAPLQFPGDLRQLLQLSPPLWLQAELFGLLSCSPDVGSLKEGPRRAHPLLAPLGWGLRSRRATLMVGGAVCDSARVVLWKNLRAAPNLRPGLVHLCSFCSSGAEGAPVQIFFKECGRRTATQRWQDRFATHQACCFRICKACWFGWVSGVACL